MLLIVAFPLGDFSNAIVRGSEGVLLGLLWGSIAYALLRSALYRAQPSEAVPAAAAVPHR